MMKQATPLYDVREIHTFRDILDSSAELFGDRSAFKVREKEGLQDVSFAEVKEQVDTLGAALWLYGLQGKNIALMGGNSYEWCLSYLAITCGLGPVVPIDKDLPPEDVLNILTVSKAAMLLVDPKTLKKLKKKGMEFPEALPVVVLTEAAGEDLPEFFFTLGDFMKTGRLLRQMHHEAVKAYETATIDPDAMAVLSFTSGTSGMQKGVMLSQNNICFDIMSTLSVVQLTPEDQLLAVLPLHHTFECTLGFLAPFYIGACNAFNESVLRMPRDLKEVEPTIFVTVPLILEKMHDRILKAAAEKAGDAVAGVLEKVLNKTNSVAGRLFFKTIQQEIQKFFGGKLRLVIVGAAPMRPDVVRDLKSMGVTTYIGYGMTECSPLICGNHDGLATEDTVGEPIPGVDVKLLSSDEDGIGEILVKGPNVMLGYYGDEMLTHRTIDSEGWLHTGDLGQIGEDGLLRITGRTKNVIVTSNGKNIYPEEVEYRLAKSPYVAECIVVGVEKDAATGTIVGAEIYPDKDAIRKSLRKDREPTEEDIRKRVEEAVKKTNKLLPAYKRIMEFTIREEPFAKTTTQKIKR